MHRGSQQQTVRSLDAASSPAYARMRKRHNGGFGGRPVWAARAWHARHPSTPSTFS
jgi:hypothetical protein